MRRAVTAYGPPEMVLLDNGKPQKKAAKGAQFAAARGASRDARIQELDSFERTGFLARLGISVIHSIPFHPQSKPIERWFGTLHKRFDAVHSTYTSGSPFTRPESTEALMMRHRYLLRGPRRRIKAPTCEPIHPRLS